MDGSKRRWLGGALGLAVAALLAWGPPQAPARAQTPAQGGDVIVFAAASLKNALDAVNAAVAEGDRQEGRRSPMPQARRWPSRSSRARRPTCSSRPTSTGWTTSRGKNLIKPETRVQPARQPHRADRAEGQARRRSRSSRASTSPRLLGDGRLAMANVDAVPAGKYGKAALEKLGVWAGVSGKRRAGRERARGAAAGVARRGAARHRLPDRRGRRSQRQDHRHVPGGHAPADRLSDRADGRSRAIPTPPPSSPISSRRRPGRRSRRRASRC